MRFLVDLLARQRRLLLFVSWGATLLVLIKLGGYQAFLRPEFGILLKAGYIILLLLVVAELFRTGEAPVRGSMLLSPAILLVPILFMLNARGAELDGYAAKKRLVGAPRIANQGPAAAGQTSIATAPAPVADGGSPATAVCPSAAAGGPTGKVAISTNAAAAGITILDLHRCPDQYEGKQVSLVAMTMRSDEVRKDFGPRSMLAFRFRVTCCAADAQPFAVVVLAKRGQSEHPDNEWIRVEGRFRTHLARGDKIPVIEDATVSSTVAPEAPYLY